VVGSLLRGRVYAAVFEHIREEGEKYYLVVSNNDRNRRLPQALAARLTTSSKPRISSIIELGQGEVLAGGRVLCDDIAALYPEEVKRDLGVLSPGAMSRVDDGLRAAFGLA
jgi:mRNA interferase MazF